MGRSHRTMALALVAVLSGRLCASGPPSEPYAPDEHTLFLHHFDGATGRGGLEPDMAAGVKVPMWLGPGSVEFTPGKFGKAIVFDETAMGLRFEASKNVNSECGTVEFFVRPAAPPGETRTFSMLWQAIGNVSSKTRFAIGIGEFNCAWTHTTPSDCFADFLDAQLGLKAKVSHWKANEWHHIAVCWDKTSARLILDGVRVAAGKFPGLGPETSFTVGFRGAAAMDELRISDIQRSELEMENKVMAETPFTPTTGQAGPKAKEMPKLPQPTPRPAVVKVTTGAPQLFVDDYLIQSQGNLFRRLGQIHKHDKPVILPDKPWDETAAFPFGSGAYRLAPDKWVMWYMTYRRWLSGGERTSVCFATSKDGLAWEKPSLGLCKVTGTTENNVVLSFGLDNCSVVIDESDPNPDRRYKAAIYTDGDEGAGVYGWTSPDGLHWVRQTKALVARAGDRTTMWYDTLRKKLVLFTRYSPILPGRYIFRSESADFTTWTTPELILDWTAIDKAHRIEHYGADGFVYGDMYLGFLEMFHVPYRRLDTEVISSRDGRAWQRVCEGETFLPNGGEKDFDRFWAFPACMPPIRVGDELWFYYSGRQHPHYPPLPPIHPGKDDSGKPRHSFYSATGLFTMRVDGFAAMDASGVEGQLLTVPLTFEKGSSLHINANANMFPPGSSWLKCGILDENGCAIPGFGSDDFEALAEDHVDHVAKWKGGSDISAFAGRPVRLHFRLVNTRLYSFTIQ